MRTLLALVSAFFVTVLPAQGPDGEGAPFRSDHVMRLEWRNLGPSNMGGRVTDIAVPATDHSTWYVATAGGGLWKTRNRGTTWQALFQQESVASIGDVAIAPSNPDIVWVGTGEENARNSVSFGDGVYKSVDAGKTWRHMGLSDTFQIGHIEIHPTNPDIVFVAALGRLWGHNQERGIFRTTDGGLSWEKVLYLDEKTGGIDVRMDPREPNTIYAAMYERMRDIYCSNDPAVKYGDLAGIYRSDDGGMQWKRLTNGLPTCRWGRTGLALHGTKAGVLFAVIETERSGWTTGLAEHGDPANPVSPVGGAYLGLNGEDGDGGAKLTSVTPGGPAARAGLQQDDVIRALGTPGSATRIRNFQDLVDHLQGAAPETRVTATVRRPGTDDELTIELTYGQRPAAGGDTRVSQAILGIQGEDFEGGARLSQVTTNGSAARAGLQVDDVVQRLGDQDIGSYADLVSAIGRYRSGDKTTIHVRRAADTITAEVTFDARAQQQQQRRAGGAFAGSVGGAPSGQVANVQERQGPDGHETGGIFRSDDRGETWRRLNSLTERPFYYSKLIVDPVDEDHMLSLGTSLWQSLDGGTRFRSIHRNIHVDFHAAWICPEDSDYMVLGNDGGVALTYDRGRTWQTVLNIPIGQFYHADVDDSTPYNIYGGLQDNGTWRIPSRVPYREGITAMDCVTILGGDGFTARIDPEDPDVVYATSQYGAISRVHMATGARAAVQKPRGNFRYNWDTPFFLSPHNPRILYFAGNRFFRSLHRGEKTEVISEDLGRTARGTATAIAESPVQPGLLYAGTDEGSLWRTKDGGRSWEPLHDRLPLPGPRYVSSIHPSHHAAGRVYATFDGHRSDDHGTYVFVSEDMGDTWTSLLANLPDVPVFVCRDVPTGPFGKNEDLLFLGTEFGIHVSLDRGRHWLRLGKDFPTTAVRDLVIQDRHSDLVLATHGRGIFVLDIAPLRQLTAEVAKKPMHLFQPQALVHWHTAPRTLSGNRDWRCPNPPDGVPIHLLLAEKPAQPPVLTIHDITGKQVASVTGAALAGLQAIQFDGRAGTSPRSTRLPAGNYSVRFELNGARMVQPLRIETDPRIPAAAAAAAMEAEATTERE